jgi:hypothetical protein
MDREVWAITMAEIRKAARAVKAAGRRPTFPDWLIAAMELWRVGHNESLSWACDRKNYHGPFRPRKRADDGRCLPSISRFSRRVKSEAVQAILQRVDDALSGRGTNGDAGTGCGTGTNCDAGAGSVRYVDGKPLLVSPVSKDPDAARGHVTGGFAKGYKLHAFISERRRIQAWSVMPLNVAEQSVAMEMLPYLAPAPCGAGAGAGGLTMGDSNYDSAPLHKGLAVWCGDVLLTPLKGQQRVGPGGHHPVTLRQMGPQRREAVEVWDQHPELARYVLKKRNNAEGTFSVLTVACGLYLPACVRRLQRVRRWVGCKIILYHARLLAQERAEAAAAA